MVQITSFNFTSIHLVIIAKLETFRSQKVQYINIQIIHYNTDIGSDGNIMAYNIFNFFTKTSKEHVAATTILYFENLQEHQFHNKASVP